MQFDFSDHLVLNLVQFMLPSLMEAYYCLSFLIFPMFDDVESIKTNIHNKPSTPKLYHRLPAIASISLSVGITCLCFRSVLLTCMFFHTFGENLVGFVLASLVAFMPLYWSPAALFWVDFVSN